MKSPRSAAKRSQRISADEAGFTIIEMVIAIPIVFLVLGLVFSSVGVTVGLMGQVTASAGAARIAGSTVDELNSARNCAEVASIIGASSTIGPTDKFTMNFGGYSCEQGKAFQLQLEVHELESDKLYYSKNLTLVAV